MQLNTYYILGYVIPGLQSNPMMKNPHSLEFQHHYNGKYIHQHGKLVSWHIMLADDKYYEHNKSELR